MNKKKIVRVELLLLAVLAVLVVSRVFQGLPTLDGEVTINDISRADLEHKAFEVLDAADVTIVAFGSLEDANYSRSSEAPMAAYPWIIRRSDRKLVWKMDPANAAVQEGGMLLRAENTVSLEPGLYDLYYATFGSSKNSARDRRLFGVRLGEHWTADRKRWQVALRAESGSISAIRDEDDTIGPENMDNVIWASGPMRNRKHADEIVAVDSPVEVSIYSIGEICSDSACGDYGMIENVATGDVVWRLTENNSKPAGGSASNFVYDGTITLDSGIYRLSYHTDAGHAYRSWHGNPPFDPAAWGMTVYSTDEKASGNVRPFDIWAEREPAVKLAPARNSATFEQTFTVTETTDILVYGMGEIDGNNRYDYGWLDNLDNGEVVWSMNEDNVRRAGGSRDNSVAEEYLTLEAGRYSLNYVSDDSHSYGSWERDKPDHEERWGVTLFSLSDAESSTILITESASKPQARGETHTVKGKEVFAMLRAGNNQSEDAKIELISSSRLHIRAIGEISQSGEYDFGWIRQEPSGTIVWKMDRTNTISAGGDERFRLFDGIVTMEEGSYSIHFETDESHAYGDFRDASPDFQSDYGMRVVLLSE